MSIGPCGFGFAAVLPNTVSDSCLILGVFIIYSMIYKAWIMIPGAFFNNKLLEEFSIRF